MLALQNKKRKHTLYCSDRLGGFGDCIGGGGIAGIGSKVGIRALREDLSDSIVDLINSH